MLTGFGHWNDLFMNRLVSRYVRVLIAATVTFYGVALGFMGVLVSCSSLSKNAAKAPAPSSTSNANGSTSAIWAEKTPFPHTAPLPPGVGTDLDGTYTKFDPKKTPPVPCRRCPDYLPAGGIWKLNLSKGVFRIFHKFTGWRSIGSFVVDGNQVQLFNDPSCIEVMGSYTWKLKEGRLELQVVGDECAIGMRAKNLSQLPWMSCQPSSIEAGFSGHRNKPAGCD